MDMRRVSSLARSSSSPGIRTIPDSRTWAARVRGILRKSTQSTSEAPGIASRSDCLMLSRSALSIKAGAMRGEVVIAVDPRLAPGARAVEVDGIISALEARKQGGNALAQLLVLPFHVPSSIAGRIPAVNGEE